MRGEVNFLIGFQSPILPRGVCWRKLAVVAWVEMSLQNAQGWLCEVWWWLGEIVKFSCLQRIEAGRTQNQSSVWREMSSDALLSPSYLARCSATTIKHVVYHTERKKLIPEPVYVGLATACKTLPWRRRFAFCFSSWFHLASLCYHCSWPPSILCRLIYCLGNW